MKKLFKSLVILLICIITLFTLSGCNKQIFDFQYSFDHVYFYETDQLFEIKSWTDYENGDQLQITLTDGTVMLVHSQSVALLDLDDNKNPLGK